MAQTREGAIKVAAKKAGTTTADYVRRMESGQKWCTTCRLWHRIGEFGRDGSRWDGLASACNILHTDLDAAERRLVLEMAIGMAIEGELSFAQNHILRLLADLFQVPPPELDGLYRKFAGEGFPEVEDAVRFKVLPSIYKVEEIAPGRIRIRKVEAVDPRGSMSPLMNNYIISLVFFRNYMFEQAKAMRDTLAGAQG